MDTSVSNTSRNEPASKGWFARNLIWFVIVALFVISNSGIYFYQQFQQTKQAKRFAEEIDKKAQLTRDLVDLKNKETAAAIMRTLVWGVRGEMMRGNKELVDRFLIQMAQETQVDLVIVEDTNHVIYLSTDKKYENQAVGDILPAVPALIDRPKVLKTEIDEIVLASPIMGEEVKLGVLFLVYKPDRATLKGLEDAAINPFLIPEK